MSSSCSYGINLCIRTRFIYLCHSQRWIMSHVPIHWSCNSHNLKENHTHTNQARTNFSKAVRNILRSLMLKVKCTDATEILWLGVEESNMVFSYWFTFSLNLREKCLLSSDSCIFHIIKDIEKGSYIELRRLWVCDTWVGYSFGVWLECLVMFQLSRIAWS